MTERRKEPPRFYSVADVAEICGISLKTARRWIAAGELAAYKLGHQLRISDDDLRAFLAEHRR